MFEYADGYSYFVEQKFYKNRIEVSFLTKSVANRKGYYKKTYRQCEKYDLYVDAFKSRARAKRYYDRVCEMSKTNIMSQK